MRRPARADKVLRLKLAKEEAENEIMAYRQLREDQFQKYSADVCAVRLYHRHRHRCRRCRPRP